jgi:RNA-binding protein YlmH
VNYSNIQSLLTDSERLLLKRASELRLRAEEGAPAFSDFLSPRERFILSSFGLSSPINTDNLTMLDSICFFYGGYPHAERTVFCAIPSFYAYSADLLENSKETDLPVGLAKDELDRHIAILRIHTSGYVNLTHRDYLGSIVGLGLDRSVIGDILTDQDGAYFFCLNSVTEFIISELTKVGRDKVKVDRALLPHGFEFKREFEAVTGTLASARLDAVVSELARTSRENAKDLIRRGLVEHNHFTAVDYDSSVSNGDVVSIKRDGKVRFGKYIIDDIDGRTGKGRIRLLARKYV